MWSSSWASGCAACCGPRCDGTSRTEDVGLTDRKTRRGGWGQARAWGPARAFARVEAGGGSEESDVSRGGSARPRGVARLAPPATSVSDSTRHTSPKHLRPSIGTMDVHNSHILILLLVSSCLIQEQLHGTRARVTGAPCRATVVHPCLVKAYRGFIRAYMPLNCSYSTSCLPSQTSTDCPFS